MSVVLQENVKHFNGNDVNDETTKSQDSGRKFMRKFQCSFLKAFCLNIQKNLMNVKWYKILPVHWQWLVIKTLYYSAINGKNGKWRKEKKKFNFCKFAPVVASNHTRRKTLKINWAHSFNCALGKFSNGFWVAHNLQV